MTSCYKGLLFLPRKTWSSEVAVVGGFAVDWPEKI